MLERISLPNRRGLADLWRAKPAAEPQGASALHAPPATQPADTDALVEQLIEQGRCVLLLRPQIAETLSSEHLRLANQKLDRSMAMVPKGQISIERFACSGPHRGATTVPPICLEVESTLLDRYPVTNREYQIFVEQGGYEQQSLWRSSVWNRRSELIDSTNIPSPRYWARAKFPPGKGEHPVVGISWFEADAYARWAGKRLVNDSEWVKAACWPIATDGGPPVQRRFPWGNNSGPEHANLWQSGRGGSVPVTEFASGVGAGGHHQLLGNVWEWTATPFQPWLDGAPAALKDPWITVRGAAFDTYFDCHATSQAQSAENPLARKHNIGFRCAVASCDLMELEVESAARSDGGLA